MTELLLIRHGETAWNAERRLQGHTDIALNEEGRRQARALGLALAGESIAAVHASDLARAAHTAEAIAGRHGLAVTRHAGLRERCYGAFEGLRYADIAERYPAQYAAWQARDVDAALPPGEREGETFRRFFERTMAAIGRIAAQHTGRRIALVAHGGVLECAYRAAQGLPLGAPRDFAIPNASINRLTWSDGRLALVSWGDTAHLQAGALDELA
jgi:probable phosphoglycerate mutase